jgi:hypothetical protein
MDISLQSHIHLRASVPLYQSWHDCQHKTLAESAWAESEGVMWSFDESSEKHTSERNGVKVHPVQNILKAHSLLKKATPRCFCVILLLLLDRPSVSNM